MLFTKAVFLNGIFGIMLIKNKILILLALKGKDPIVEERGDDKDRLIQAAKKPADGCPED